MTNFGTKSFFSEFINELEFEISVRNKVEYYTLHYVGCSRKNPLKTIECEIGRTLTDFIYDKNFDVFTSLLVLDSENYVRQIKAEPDKLEHWSPFINLAREIYYDKQVHPYYYFILKSIVNAYKNGFRNPNGVYFPDDYFSIIGKSFVALRDKIMDYMLSFDKNETGQAMDVYHYSHRSGLTKHYLNVRYEVVLTRAKNRTLQQVMCPETLDDIWCYIISNCILSNLRFKRCENCMRYFATTPMSKSRYCDYAYSSDGRSCRQIMPKIDIQLKAEKEPAHWLFNRAYKTMYFRVSSGKLSKELYKEWSKEARAKRDECLAGKIKPEEYSEWLCDNGLNIDYLKDI